MNKHITDRRIAFVKQFLMIRDVKKSAENLVKLPEFAGDSISVILRDWGRRHTWLEAVVRITDPSVLHEIAAEIKWVLDQAHVEYLRNPDEKIKIPKTRKTPEKEILVSHSRERLAALHAVQEAAVGLADILLETGKLQKAPLQIQATVTDEIDISKISEQDRDVLVTAAKIIENQSSKGKS